MFGHFSPSPADSLHEVGPELATPGGQRGDAFRHMQRLAPAPRIDEASCSCLQAQARLARVTNSRANLVAFTIAVDSGVRAIT